MSDPDDTKQYPHERRSADYHRRRISLVWIVPLVALVAAIWLGWSSWNQRGPTIKISFVKTEGLEAGKTQIKHKDVVLGTVAALAPTADFSSVIVTAKMGKIADPYLNEGTKFWIVRPRFTAGGITGLNTLVSGAYIELDPGQGDTRTDFTGLEEPLAISPGEPGQTYTLHAPQLGSLETGSPVFYHGVNVGEVATYDLEADSTIALHLFIHAPYDKLVHEGTRFWNASGIGLSAGPEGLKVTALSLQTVLAGGINFDVPADVQPGAAAAPNASFQLYPDAGAAYDTAYTYKNSYLLHYYGSASGLEAGAAVTLLGKRIGRVREVNLELDWQTAQPDVAVIIDLQPQRVTFLHDDPDDKNPTARADKLLRRLVAQGLRAQLVSSSLLTGQKNINFTLLPDAPPAQIITSGKYVELPTVQPDDIDAVLHETKQVLANINRLAGSPEMKHSLQSLDQTLANLNTITHEVSPQIGPLLSSLRNAADSADQAVKQAGATGEGGGDLPGTLRELKDAARSVRVLADYLEAHPETLLRGKSEGTSP